MFPASPGLPDPQPVPPANVVDPARAGVFGYWLGAGSMVLAVMVWAIVVALTISTAKDALRFPTLADGTGGVEVQKPGDRVLFVVEPISGGGQFQSSRPTITVVGPDGQTVAVGDYSGSRTATGSDPVSGERLEASAVGTFEADQTGRYQLSAPDLTVGTRLGVGEGVDFDGGSIGFAALGGGVLFLVGLVLLIVTAVRRRPPPLPPGPYGGSSGAGLSYPGPYGAGLPAPGPPIYGHSAAPSGAYPYGMAGPGSLAPPSVDRRPAWVPPPPPPSTPAGWPPVAASQPPEPPGPGATRVPESSIPWGNLAPDYRTPRDEDFAPPSGPDSPRP